MRRLSASPWLAAPALLGGALAAVLLGACESAFDPREDSDRYFSLFGYLDTSVDTQYVRVTPLRTAVITSAEPLEAEVTLEHMPSGEISPLRDSVFAMLNGFVHNFYVPVTVAAGESYRLTARGAEGTSTVLIEMPPDFPTPKISLLPFSPEIYITTVGVAQLAEIRWTYTLSREETGERFEHIVSYLDQIFEVEGDTTGFAILVNPGVELQKVREEWAGLYDVERIELLIAGAGPDWPDAVGVELETLALPDYIRNVDNGIGYVGGIISKSTWIYRRECGWLWQCVFGGGGDQGSEEWLADPR